METRSGRRLTSPPPPPGSRRRRGPRDADLISALPDDILLLVLVRLRSVCEAARTGLLSRRWRGLWTRLPDLDFRQVAPATVESVLSRFAASPAVSLLHIRIHLGHAAAEANSLLRAAALLSPARLRFCFLGSREDSVTPIELPCFHRTTSIRLVIILPRVKAPTAGEFTVLERLTLIGSIDNLGALLTRCLRLRVLDITFTSTQPLRLTPPSNSEFPALESVALNGNIVDLGIFLNRCPRLREIAVAFHGVAPDALEAALATLEAMEARGATESSIAILIPIAQSDTATLLRAAVRLSPQELILTDLSDTQGPQCSDVDLPCFQHATSIEITLPNICFKRLLDGEFSVLEVLYLKGCIVGDLGTLVSRCPRLRVLNVKAAMSKRDIMVHSASLQELILGTYTECRGVDIVTPMLKELEMKVQADSDINVFISAPMVDKVSWSRSYTGLPVVFGFWHLQNLSLLRRLLPSDDQLQDLSPMEAMLTKMLLKLSPTQELLTINHELFVDMCASDSSNAELNFAQEIEKVLLTDFSVLNIRLKAVGHVYGATLLHLCSALLHVRPGMKLLKIILLRSKKSEVTQACSGNCPCDSPTTWRSQSISMTHLEEMGIKGVKGEGHELDFLKLILRCAPSLKRMTVELGNGIRSYKYGGCTKKINNITLEYPSVDFHVSVSGRLVLHACSSCS